MNGGKKRTANAPQRVETDTEAAAPRVLRTWDDYTTLHRVTHAPIFSSSGLPSAIFFNLCQSCARKGMPSFATTYRYIYRQVRLLSSLYRTE